MHVNAVRPARKCSRAGAGARMVRPPKEREGARQALVLFKPLPLAAFESEAEEAKSRATARAEATADRRGDWQCR